MYELSHVELMALLHVYRFQASIINSHEYKSWREQGVAFELRSDSTYEVTNRTLASGILIKKVVRETQ